MSIGIAEVTLPKHFKQANIEETDESRRKIEEERTAKYDDRVSRGKKMLTSGSAPIAATGTARFWNPQMSLMNQQSQDDKANAIAAANKNVVSGPAMEIKADKEFSIESDDKITGMSDGKSKPKKSTDDHAVNKFKNNERNRR
jgi:hypothetical protein